MRILVHDYAGHPFAVSLSRELSRRGHEVNHAFAANLLTPRGSLTPLENDSDRLSFTEVFMSPRYPVDKYSFVKRRNHEIAYGKQLSLLVALYNPEIIISGQTPTEPQWEMVQCAQNLDIPFISWVQDFYSIAVESILKKRIPYFGSLVARYYKALDTRCFSLSKGVIAITDDFVPILNRYGVPNDKITVIPNWAPLEEMPLQSKTNHWSSKHGLDDKFVFLYSGTLAMKHNPELLLQLAHAFLSNKEIVVVVVSEGPGMEYLKSHTNRNSLPNLRLLPFQDFKEMPFVLASADVLLTILENDAGIFSVPSKVLTYHAAGRPILGAMPIANLASRIITNNGTGECVEAGNIQAFVACARRLHSSPTLRQSMGLKAREYSERTFKIEAVTNAFESVFSKILNRS